MPPDRPSVLHGPTLALPGDLPRTLAGCIEQRVRRNPNGMLRSIGTSLYRESRFDDAWARAGTIGSALRRHVARDRPAVLFQEEHIDRTVAFWACIRAGRTADPLHSTATAALRQRDNTELPRLLECLGAPAFLVDVEAALVDRIRALFPDAQVLLLDALEREGGAPLRPAAEDAEPACFVATSGSTGRAKLVGLDAAALAHRYFSANYGDLGRDDRVLGLFPFDSITGLRAAFLGFADWTQVARQIVVARPLEVLETIERFAITATLTTNSLASYLVEASGRFRGDLSSLRKLGFGGEAVTRAVALGLQAMLLTFGSRAALLAGYGSTETGPVVCGADPTVPDADGGDRVSLGSSAAGMAIRIVDDTERIVPEGVLGHIELRCPQTMFSRYADGIDDGAMTDDGWWKTGDLGDVRDGGFAVRGRSKDVVIAGGAKLSLVDIDLFLQSSDNGWAAWSFALRRASDATEQLGIAFRAEPEAHADAAQTIRSAVARRFGLLPRHVVPLGHADLPLTATGKVDRARLSAVAGELIDMAAPAGRQGGDAVARVAAAWRAAFGFDVAHDIDFFDAGGDSHAAVLLGLAWEDGFGAPLPANAFRSGATIVSMAAALEGDAAPAVFDDLAPVVRQQRQLLANWRGRRPTRAGLVVGRAETNRPGRGHWRRLAGLLPRRAEPAFPSFWILQLGVELALLQDHLPPAWDPHGLRSGHLLSLADHPALFGGLVDLYVDEICEVQPSGPYRIGGVCQGSVLAMAVATRLEADGHRVALVTIVDFDLASLLARYRVAAPIAFIAGSRSHFNPALHREDPLSDLRRLAPGGLAMRLVAADHAEIFLESVAADLVRAITQSWTWASRLGTPSPVVSRVSHRRAG